MLVMFHAIGDDIGERIDQVLQRTPEAVDLPTEHSVKLPAMNVRHQAIKLRA
jgi:hypothetical protein